MPQRQGRARRRLISSLKTFHITLLRHPESEGNVARIPQGHADAALTARGEAQGQALAARWEAEGRSFDQIISSPLRRARWLGELVAERLDAPLEIDEIWLERDVGQMNTLDLAEVDAHYDRPQSNSPYHDAFGLGGEGQWQLYLRAGEALHGLLNRDPGAFLVVSHGGLMNALMSAILGLAPQAFGQGPRFRFENCSISELSYQAEGHRWLVIKMNDTQHLSNLGGAQ